MAAGGRSHASLGRLSPATTAEVRGRWLPRKPLTCETSTCAGGPTHTTDPPLRSAKPSDGLHPLGKKVARCPHDTGLALYGTELAQQRLGRSGAAQDGAEIGQHPGEALDPGDGDVVKPAAVISSLSSCDRWKYAQNATPSPSSRSRCVSVAALRCDAGSRWRIASQSDAHHRTNESDAPVSPVPGDCDFGI